MRPPAVTRQQTGNPVADRVQGDVRRVADSLRSFPWTDGVQVGPVTFAGAASVTVPHKLGRTPVGFIIIDARAGLANPYRAGSDARTITLQSAAAGIVTLWVF